MFKELSVSLSNVFGLKLMLLSYINLISSLIGVESESFLKDN